MNYKQEDLKILGFSESEKPSLDEINKKYEQLISEYMSYTRQGKNTAEDDKLMSDISKAYNSLTGKEDKEKADGWFQGFNKKTLSNFVYLFKIQIFVVVFLIVCAGVTIYQVSNRVEYDMKVMVAGGMQYDEMGLETKMKRKVPTIENMSLRAFDSLGAEAFVALYISKEIDIMFVDAEDFEVFAKQGYFMSLDEIAKNNKLKLKEHADFVVSTESDEKEHLYGIDVSNCKLVNDVILNDSIVACVLRNSENKEKAISFIDCLMKELTSK